MSFAIDISLESEDWAKIPGIEALVRRAAEAALLDNDAPPSEISVVLSGDEHIRELNKHHRGMDKPTNVLSFPAARMKTPAGGPRLLGDVVLAFETCQREAAEEAKPIENHVTHLVVHGVLHLLGYDHEDDDEAETMEGRERQILAKLGIPDPYAERGAAAKRA
ncbi:MAG: rRNA maturation RNase YbeY [Xanthobacteraceae bacterium]|nr:rRNA maturation RNase YbeY [Xanthobacteraceae bacterium]MBX3524489.1 rRNA maturation RNase YbeY [Xanthobacteraceae bacterium]MBX3533998.1 rRNA maturation RNase YbeY [Xanthobacteraceae bacterium]MCW5673351.1 rRNA maturation RNase YbeY [Xanthobacteraceae bacterium]MCW5677539.1 rRNA maturation RNase YbeY [Xanthobacteraceae bacterium]